MAKVDISVSVEQSGYDLMKQLAAIAKQVKADHAAGGLGISGDVSALVAGIVPIIKDIGMVSGDFAEDKVAMLKGINLAAYDLLDL